MGAAVEVIENFWIDMPDGVRLAARAWLPGDARDRPVPALLEYLPYRKRDLTRARDEPMHRYFAENGYASVRVDLRGSGDSEGLLDDEYTGQEHDDGVAVIAALAAQPWCDGNVGMFGISWGGFNALQIAARRPPALKAIMSLCAADDRYSDDAHYMGGCLLTENLQWGAVFMLNQALPPDPDIAGEGWRDTWRARLEHLPNFPALWLEHPWRDAYWEAGSVRYHPERIDIPVYAIGGWADGYSNAVPRLVAALDAPCKGLIGPWAHTFPHLGTPGPRIGFLQEALRWWDRWLKGIDNGIETEPVLRAWMQESVSPEPQYAERPGRWIAEDAWPSSHIDEQEWFLNATGLSKKARDVEELLLLSPQTCGIRGGEWCAFGSDGEMPRDQRPDDGYSLSFDSRPLAGRLEILGAPRVTLRLRADQPQSNLCVRLCDVAPDGSSLRVSYGVLNLAHRDGHTAPKALEPGEFVDVTVALNDIAHAFPAGHRLRIALSTSYWPTIWPSASNEVLGVVAGESRLTLPVRAPRESDAGLREFESPEMAEGLEVDRLRRHAFRRRLLSDLTSNTLRYELHGSEFDDASLVHIKDIDLKVGYTLSKHYEIQESDPLSATETIEQKASLRRGEFDIEVDLVLTQTADGGFFYIRGQLDARDGDTTFLQRQWDLKIPRRLV